MNTNPLIYHYAKEVICATLPGLRIWHSQRTVVFVYSAHSSVPSVSLDGSAVCKRCKAKVANGLKCSDCQSYFHPSCAKLVNKIQILEESNLVRYCGNESTNDDDVELCNVLSDFVDSDNKIDIRFVKYILKQKEVISELRDKNTI